MYEGRVRPLSTLSVPFSEELLVIPSKESDNYLSLSEAAASREKNLSGWPDDFYFKVAQAKDLKETEAILHENTPFNIRLELEALYHKLPFQKMALVCYFIALFWRTGLFYSLAFVLHTLLLLMRGIILGRPPVANMEETVLYVPWIGALLAGGAAYFLKERFPLKIGAFLACLLLALPQDSAMDTLVPVLNSRFWLTVHVLMIVASYGVLIFSGILGHVYLFTGNTTAKKLLLPTLYIGVALLIPGTILGGVWAAESWGRFWDWDPKEAWAFISAAVYLIFIHAWRYRKISAFGLAIGSVLGLMAISFTWYGVNYILGTGLHSYGFGHGGTLYYWIFLASEAFMLSTLLILRSLKINLPCDN